MVSMGVGLPEGIFALGFALISTVPCEVGGEREKRDLWTCTEVLVDASGRPSLAASVDTKAMRPLDGPILDLGLTEAAVWLRTELELEEGEPTVISYGAPSLDSVRVWTFPGGEFHELGEGVPPDHREHPWPAPALELAGGPQRRVTVWARAESLGPLVLTPRAESARRHQGRVMREQRLAGAIQGIGATLIFTFGFLAFFVADRIYGWYAVHVAAALVYQGCLEGWWASLVALQPRWGSLLLLASFLAGIFTANRYLAALFRPERRRWSVASIVVLLATLSLPLFPHGVLVFPVALGVFIGLGSIAAEIYPALRERRRLAWGVLVAWVPLALSGGGMVLRVVGVAPWSKAALVRTTTASLIWEWTVMAAVLAMLVARRRQREGEAKAEALEQARRRILVEKALRERDRELLAARRSEAVGRLAGGIAHDFNNLLTVVLGNASELRLAATGTDERELLDEVLDAGRRGESLIRQLLDYSARERGSDLTPVKLDELLRGMANLLRRHLGANSRLELELNAYGARVMTVPSQLERVIVNLVVNARQAMPAGGTVRIQTAALARDRLRLRITDTGCGIPDEVREHIFEPFFTTKGPSEGTGLGLATVAGVVAQLGGQIDVSSKVGEGTRFDIVLPSETESSSGEDRTGDGRGEPREAPEALESGAVFEHELEAQQWALPRAQL